MSRVISIERTRLPRWLRNFATRHGEVQAVGAPEVVRFRATDGAEAAVAVPFAPLPADPEPGALRDTDEVTVRLLDHVARDRRVGAVLVRRGGYAVGVFDGDRLISARNGSGYVQGRTKAGGWSQQRYARRRANQAQQLYDKASAAAAEVLLPVAAELVAVVGGGDRAGVLATLEPVTLQPVRELLQDRIHATDDPRRRVLEAFPETFLSVEIELNDRA